MKIHILTAFVFMLSYNVFAQFNKNYISYETTSLIKRDTCDYQLYFIGRSILNENKEDYKDIIEYLIMNKNVRTIFFDGSIADEWIMNQIKIYHGAPFVLNNMKKFIDRRTYLNFRKSFPYLVNIDELLLDSLRFFSIGNTENPNQFLNVMSSILKKHSQYAAATEILFLQGDIYEIAKRDDYNNYLDSLLISIVGTKKQLKKAIGIEDFTYFNNIFRQLKTGLKSFVLEKSNLDSLNIVSAKIIESKLNFRNKQKSLIITDGQHLIDKKDMKLVSDSKLHYFSTRLAILLPYKKCKIRHFCYNDREYEYFPMSNNNIILLKELGEKHKQIMLKTKFKDSPFIVDYDYIIYTK